MTIIFLKESFLKTNYEIRIYTNDLKVKNVKIYNSGPFTFTSTSNIIQITGDNASGKTLLAKAIGGDTPLVKFEGSIQSPKFIYIGL